MKFENVGVILREKDSGKSQMLYGAYFIFRNKDLSTGLSYYLYIPEFQASFSKKKKKHKKRTLHYLFSRTKREEKEHLWCDYEKYSNKNHLNFNLCFPKH